MAQDLATALERGDRAAVQRLLDAGGVLHHYDWCAVEGARDPVETVRILFELGCPGLGRHAAPLRDASALQLRAYEAMGIPGEHLVHASILQQEHGILRRCIERGYAPQPGDIVLAVRQGRPEAVDLLARELIPCGEAMYQAALRRNPGIADACVGAGGRFEDWHVRRLASAGASAALRFLLQRGFRLESPVFLEEAARHGRRGRTLGLMLEAGAPPGEALAIALSRGHAATARQLREHGVGWPPRPLLAEAARAGRPREAALLVELGFPPAGDEMRAALQAPRPTRAMLELLRDYLTGCGLDPWDGVTASGGGRSRALRRALEELGCPPG